MAEFAHKMGFEESGGMVPDPPAMHGGEAFDARSFLDAIADAYNRRDPAQLRSYFALYDPRFRMYEEFSEELLNGASYAKILSGVVSATGTVSFHLSDCRLFADYAMIHAILRLVDREGPDGPTEAIIRASLLVSVGEGSLPQVVSGHFSSNMCCFPKPVGVYPRAMKGAAPTKGDVTS